ncbi:MAG: transglutaminase-like domain-containing protein [Candidatus Thorarchaeota archaeon]|nr:transglutaminase-like domain-containing protein [Candidatus Thorarchaeota archaeon]
MSATPKTTKRKIGVTTIISTLFVVLMLVWGTITLFQVQSGAIRDSPPHTPLDDIDPWTYDLNWAGGRTNWFEGINYTDLPLDQMLPEDLLDMLNNTIFVVEPANPGQLWRSSAYNAYDGSGWSKTLSGSRPLSALPGDQATNEIYTISMNVTVSPNIEPIELPVLFPNIRVIEDSFRSIPAGRLLDYVLETDDYDTFLFSPFLSGTLDETILIQYGVTYDNQDLAHIQTHAQPGEQAEAGIQSDYVDLDVTLSETVTDEIDQFRSVGTNAYEKAMAVDVYFRSNYELLIDDENVTQRPPSNQEVTEWFIERGGGLPMDFATAYCVFMRDLGVPARMTIGYALGQPDPDGGDFRLVQVQHMMFWVEVYIPQDDGVGQWIQVIPMPLPPGFGGGDLPENLDEASVQLRVGSPDFGFPFYLVPQWAIIGGDFNLSAMLWVDGIPSGIGEAIRFYDLTDGVDLGTATIEELATIPGIGMANITFQFPTGSSIGAHNITAMWISSTYLISNSTLVVAVGQSHPLQAPPIQQSSNFIVSDIVDVDISLGLNDYQAQWNDTLHVHGLMTLGTPPDDVPANGTHLAELGNDQMWIMWDGIWYGNATIGEDGYYELDIPLDATDLLRMDTGTHTVAAYYAGAIDPDTGIPAILPGFSSNSTLSLHGAPAFSLTVTPADTYGGGSITYDGIAYLQNGTPLVGEFIGIIFDGTLNTTVLTNSSGGFNHVYEIPISQPSGTFDATVNWTSSDPLTNGGTSGGIPVTVQSGATTLTIDSAPSDPSTVHTFETITIFGTLTAVSDGAPIVGRSVEVFWDWNNGTSYSIGTSTTIAGGYYEITYDIPAFSEGLSSYWAEFDASGEPTYADSISATMNITVKRYDVEVYIETVQDSVAIGDVLDIEGIVYLPEVSKTLQNAHIILRWQNGTGVYNITEVDTSVISPYYFIFNYTIPVGHELAGIQLWAEFVSSSPEYYNNESAHIPVTVRKYDSYISAFSNTSTVHLNESVLIYGYLEHENGTPLTGYDVTIDWNNGTVYTFPVVTNSTGWYNFTYFCDPATDAEGTVTVTVYHSSIDPSYSNSSAVLSPSLTLQLYQLSLDADVDSSNIHLDEVIIFSGTLTFDSNSAPLAGATILVRYQNGTGTYTFPKTTNALGGFMFQYNCSLFDIFEAVYIWAEYTSTDPLWDNSTSLARQVNLIPYDMALTTNTNNASYYIDGIVHIYGTLTFFDNSTPLSGQTIDIYWFNGTNHYLTSVSTDGTGYFEYYHPLSPFTDSVGSARVWAEFWAPNPLWDNASTAPGVSLSISKYAPVLDISFSANPVYLNQSVTIQVHLHFGNGTDIGGEPVSIWWLNGSTHFLAGGLTDGSGLFSYVYTGMDWDIVLSVQIAANTSESTYLEAVTPAPVGLLLQRWLTLINNVDTGGSTSFFLTDTVTITGNLYYDLVSDVAYSGVQVDILVDGAVVDSTMTLSDGSFTGYWNIPALTPIGGYDITIRYISSVNWIANYTTAPITVTVDAVSIIWTFDANPSVVYRSEWLQINGTLDLDNGSVYAGATVLIYWQNPATATTPTLLATVYTDGSGYFEHWYHLSDTEDLGFTQVWAECSSGIPVISSSTSPSDIVDVQQIPVTLTGIGSHAVIYLDDTFVFSGTLTFGNGTPMIGYLVEIFWDGTSLATRTTGTGGAYSYSYYLDWDEIVRDITYYVAFVRPSEAFLDAQTSVGDLEIHDLVTVSIDAQSITSVLRGDTLIVSGTVTNGGGADEDVPLELLVDGSQVGLYAFSDASGQFSIEFLIRDTIEPGTYNISVGLNSLNYDSTGPSGYWMIQVNLNSEVTVIFSEFNDIMPNESFNISFTVSDQDANPHIGESVSVYLNGTFITTLIIADSSLNTHTIIIPAGSWTAGSGMFVAVVVYSGSQYVLGSSAETEDSIHVFDEAVISNLGPGYAVINQPITLEGLLLDSSGIPVKLRSITLTLNDSTTVTLRTDENGAFSYQLPVRYSTEGHYTFSAAFVMSDASVVRGTWTFQITSGLPPEFDTALLITWAALVAIEAIVAMLIVAKYRYSGRGFSFSRFRISRSSSEIHDSLVR